MAAGVSLLRDLSPLTAGGYSSDTSGDTSGGTSGDTSRDTSRGTSRGTSRDMETADARVPTAKYTKMGETLRHVIPGHMQCSMTCGGRSCKYENPTRWSPEEQAVTGLYSSWITDSLLAMARPSTDIIEKYNVIEQFQRCGLKTVINLQRPGEHASCGNALEPESGFTYRPEIFMEAGIYYYNFGWKDYGVASLTTILDMVKVMSFAVLEGKMAIHCHAGLGRTGVLMACFLVFTSRMSADQAILFVRAKRPNSIQTRGQLLCVREFAQFLVPLRSVFSEPQSSSVTLEQYLTRQRHLLHGYEARHLRHVPKIVQLVCQLLSDIANNRQAQREEPWLDIPDLTAEVEKTVSQKALLQLGNELRGKGIPVSPCFSQMPCPGLLQPQSVDDQPLVSDSELDWNIPVRLCLSTNKGLSFSDSDLHKLQCEDLCVQTTALTLHQSQSHHSRLSPWDPPLSDLCRLQMPDTDLQTEAQSPFLRKRLQKGHQSLSLDLSEPMRSFYRAKTSHGEEQGDSGDVPVMSLHPEPSPDSRCLLVAKALALDLTDPDLDSKISLWQTELNCREGAWERLWTERDPLVLAALMWAWLQQLKEPIISREDVKALSDSSVNSQQALDSLPKGNRQTLLCVLECAANLLPLPEDLETLFLNQTIRVFTLIDPVSETTKGFSTLRSILTSILHDICDNAPKSRQNT